MIDPREAEQLLGGHAAGILTEAERSRLYAAALRHQELFDALADEEALRELLADPAARAHLLSLLAPAHPRPWWRRGTVLGLAATLFLVVTVRYSLKQAPLPAPAPGQSPKIVAPGEAPATPAAEETRRKDAAPTISMEPAAAQPRRAPAPPSEQGMAEAQGGAAPPPQPLAGPQPPLPALKKDAPPPPEPAVVSAAKAEAKALEKAAPAKEKAAAQGALAEISAEASADRLESQPRNRAAQGAALLSPGKNSPAPPPSWTLVPQADGRTRIRVVHGEGFPYLLQRIGDTVKVLPPRPGTAAGGLRTTDFEAALEKEDALDLYLLPQPVSRPETLPATGAVTGFRARIRP